MATPNLSLVTLVLPHAPQVYSTSTSPHSLTTSELLCLLRTQLTRTMRRKSTTIGLLHSLQIWLTGILIRIWRRLSLSWLLEGVYVDFANHQMQLSTTQSPSPS